MLRKQLSRKWEGPQNFICPGATKRLVTPLDGGRTATLRDRSDGAQSGATVEVSNQWVVPYNPYLSLRYDAHINVEYCSSIKTVR